ncbi:MAG TPA: lipase secretion chaperone [Marinobacter sp.]|nr:lipase secretion chaperone [Marinobacter sp.]
MGSKIRYGFLTAIVTVGAIGGYFYLQSPANQAAQTMSTPGHTAAPKQSPVVEATQQDLSQRIIELAVQYLERYGNTISEPATQARLYNERRILLEQYPESGAQLFDSAIEKAFPELHGQILAMMNNLDRYNQWLDNQELRLQALPTLQQEVELWQQREAIFGTLASEIWADEKSYLEEKSQVFQQKVAHLNEASELQLTELAYQLQTSAKEVYGGDVTLQFAGSSALGHALFSLDSVQAQLQQLPPERRQQAVNDLRLQLGYSEDAVERMAKQDQAREEKWQAGKAYTVERDALMQRLSGEARDTALNELREKHFGIAAPTIAREEKEGFYRFERPRQYGVN